MPRQSHQDQAARAIDERLAFALSTYPSIRELAMAVVLGAACALATLAVTQVLP